MFHILYYDERNFKTTACFTHQTHVRFLPQTRLDLGVPIDIHRGLSVIVQQRGSSYRRKGAARHLFDLVWFGLAISLSYPDGEEGDIYLFKYCYFLLPLRRPGGGGRGSAPYGQDQNPTRPTANGLT